MVKDYFLIFLLLIICECTAISQDVNHWETAIYNNDTWKYFPGISEPVNIWREISFDDVLWSEGQGGFGFGDNDDGTVIQQCTSVYLRKKFNISDTSVIIKAVLNMDYDDAFVAWINGKEIARSGISATYPAYNAVGMDHEALLYRNRIPESYIINKTNLRNILTPGVNVLCIQVHNSSATSTDLSSNAFLSFGIVNSSIYFRSVPKWFIAPAELKSSNLPIISINTQPGQVIMDEPKITAEMKIIHNGNGLRNYINDPGNVFAGKTGIEIRGRYSASLPQKPFGFETRNETGDNLDTSLLSLPSENDWILLANYNDKTFLRNFLAFQLFREMGHYSPGTEYCEVVLNSDYQGIYLLTEKIKVDKNRVDIAKLNPDENSGNDLTGGYIFKNDYNTATDSWKSNYSPVNKPGAEVRFVYYDPAPDELTIQQKTYLKEYVDAFESKLYDRDFADPRTGYRAWLNVGSFVDYFILEEITRNVDAYKKSRFYYKDKDSNGGRIVSGPVWDFDWAWKNITENCVHFNKTDGSGWAYRINECSASPTPPSWEVKMLQDPSFTNEIHDKYYILRRNILSKKHIFGIIDSVANLLDEAQVRHYDKWPILGINVGTPESGIQPDSYAGEIQKFKSWISTRLDWLDANMIGRSFALENGYQAVCRIFPNPASDYVRFESDTIITRIELFNASGIRVLEKKDNNDFSATLDLSKLGRGFYISRIYFIKGEVLTRRLIKG